MKSIINFSIKNKLAIWIVTIFIIVFGMFSAFQMKMEQLPNINEPIVDITTIYPGASSEEVSDKITNQIENGVRNLDGVKNVVSTSMQDASSIQVEYGFDKDLKEAEQEIEETIKNLNLPEDAQTPKVARLSFNDLPILVVSVLNQNSNLSEVSNLVKNEIQPAFEEIQGISTVNIVGNESKEVRINLLPERLQEYQLRDQDVAEYLNSVLNEFSLGVKEVDNQEKVVAIQSEVDIEKLKDISVPINPQSVIEGVDQTAEATPTLSDIAEVELEQSSSSISRFNGKESIGIQVVQGVNGNTVEIIDAITNKMDEFEKQYDGLTFETVLNSGDPIKDSISMMFKKALIGAAFAVLIILLFLRDIKSTLISVISIPLSLLIALLLLHRIGISLNLMTIGAMTVAIGRVVDDSIVVIENIHRKIKLSKEPLSGNALIVAATKEMFSPIMSSTIVTIAVFLPLGLVDGPVGELFYPFGLTIVFALLASLLVSITIVPMMAHFMMSRKVEKRASRDKKHRGETYRKILRWSLNHKIVSFTCINILLIGSLFLIPFIGVTFIQEDENNLLIITYDPETGDTREEINEQVETVEDYLLGREHIELVQSSQGGGNPLNPADTRQVLFFIKYKGSVEDFGKEQEVISAEIRKQTEGEWSFQDSGSGNSQMNIYVYGNNFEEINQSIGQIEDKLSNREEVKSIKTNVSELHDKLGFQLKLDELINNGVHPEQVYSALGGGVDMRLTTINEEGDDLPVYLNTAKTIEKQEDYLKLPISTLSGEEIELSEVTELIEQEAPSAIYNRNGKQYGEVTINVQSNDINKTIKDLESELKGISFGNGVNLEFGGVSDQIEDSFNQLIIASGLAIFVVFFVLIVTFGGGLAPFAILFSLPYAIIGSLVGLLLTREPISISVMIGALMLIGIVVTNAIVLVARIIQNEKEGIDLREAILEAGTTRLRPILMTAFATVGALVPLVFTGETDGSGLISRGLGITVIGGLTTSTILTLIVVPVVYEALMKMKKKFKKKRAQKEEVNIEA
ncbi:efflux RND transporter permease subunit [Cytobacillus kochii]|uniref:efflux RND transporter permease subunit n=1 Tax=Cytobacillus kochii TaxID=859143 RepID=UPI00384B3D58